MRVKEIERTANIAWSPAAQHPIYVAAGTAAQQLDATFSTSAALELYSMDLGESGMEMDKVGAISCDFRFHKLVWGSYGMDEPDMPSGLLMGGTDNGNLFVWNPAKILKDEDPLVFKLDKHTGAVAALDINPFQNNLLASGASESDIYIWDLNKPDTPMTPGAKSQPPDDVTCIGWNRQVQHILASTYAGRCVVWDLRKNEPIIKVSDSMARIKCKLVSWHPEVATQMCLASEDDHTPVIQLWDLRFATSPLKLLESHQRGILSMAWCPQDPDLLLSCAKDNRILCWNPNTNTQSGEVVYELPTSNQWCFDVQWCPRNPAMISSCSFDGHISVYSLMGGAPPPKTPSKVADSFSTDPFSQPPVQQQPQQEAQSVVLKKAPKWLRRPVGASFAFGGKLVTFENSKPPAPNQPPQRLVNVSQVVTETQLITRSNQLQAALNNGQLSEFCALKVSNSQSDVEESIWNFLKVHFETDPRQQYLQLLGYDRADLVKKVAQLKASKSASNGLDVAEITDKVAELDTSSQIPADDNAFDQIATHAKEVEEEDKPLVFSTGTDCEGLVTAALLTADFGSAVEVCLQHERYAEAIILAMAGGTELLRQTQTRFFKQQTGDLSRLISSVVTYKHENIMRTCDLNNWREALALALTYAKADQFSSLCDILGERLEREDDGSQAWNACLCYICAGNVDKLVQCWIKINRNHNTPYALQDLVEKVMLLRKAVERSSGQTPEISTGPLAEKLSQYAELLAAEGNLETAATYLGNSTEPTLAVLRDRLYAALGQTMQQKPFQVYNVQPEGVAPKQPQIQQQQQQKQQPAYSAQQSMAQNVNQNRQRTNSGFHQTVAGSFQTTTTPVSSYYSPAAYSQSQQTQYNNYTTAQTGQGVVAKGPLAQKYSGGSSGYPAPVSSAPQPNIYDPYANQQAYNPSSFGDSAPAVQPNLYNPSAGVPSQNSPGAPYSGQQQPPPPPPASQHMSSYQDHKPEAAWNDPPPVARKKTLSESSYEAPAPIRAPLPGSNVPDQGPPGAPSYQGGHYYNPNQYHQQQQQQQQQQQAPPAPAPEPPKPVQKAPIPQENIVLKTVLEALTNQCLGSSTNPQTKRKLEDVLRKLEHLYDKLRDQALSPAIIQGLHQIIQCIQQYDYQTGLAYYTQMVSQGNFSEISSFMPGIKILMQTAQHLQVYVQPVQ